MRFTLTCLLSCLRTSVRTEAAVLVLVTETEAKASPDLKHTTGESMKIPARLSRMNRLLKLWPESVSPGPPGVHLDDLSVAGFGPQLPGVTSVLQETPVVWAAVAVEDVVAMETLHAANLLQLVVLRFIWEVEGPQRRLLQDDTGTAVLGREPYWEQHLVWKSEI